MSGSIKWHGYKMRAICTSDHSTNGVHGMAVEWIKVGDAEMVSG